MIGIISHVTELKESIDRQLVVTKTKKGQSCALEALKIFCLSSLCEV